jgi:hypothetical protein
MMGAAQTGRLIMSAKKLVAAPQLSELLTRAAAESGEGRASGQSREQLAVARRLPDHARATGAAIGMTHRRHKLRWMSAALPPRKIASTFRDITRSCRSAAPLAQ